MTQTRRKTRFTRGAALLREDVVTPLHHHDDARDTLVVDVDGERRAMSPCEADGFVTDNFSLPELTDVEHVDGGPRHISRRHVLAGAAAGIGGLLAGSLMPRYSFAATGDGTTARDLLVCVFMRGGFDGLSAVAPVGDSAYYAARPTIAVRPEQTIALDDTWGLNANMAALRPLWDAGDFAVVQGSGSPEISRSHFDDQAAVERAAPANVRSGWLGRHLQTSSAQTGTLRGVTVGSASVLSLATTAMDTLAMSSLDSFDLRTHTPAARGRVRAVLDEMYGAAGGAVAEQADTTFEAIDHVRSVREMGVSTAPGVTYPDSAWGRGLAEVAKVAKAGVGVEVACLDIDDWDMHARLGQAVNSGDWFSSRSRDLAQGLASFREDLGERWATTTVVTMSEFGRRVAENGSGGLDHGQGNTMFVLGGGINGGRVYGSVPSLRASNLVLGDVPVSVDYRQALAEIVTARLGNGANLAEIFPGFTPGDPLGIA
ncbi:DUF1501 domain-containing protein [Georgenia alba]|uniref:DUF1501 domain-containing protein n=1 Tax=Georgenia alba TaxID=2233858 RepID=A0ABW2Q788_9MICO